MFIIITIHGPFHQSTRCLYMFLQRSLSIMDFWYQRSFRLDLGVRSLHCEPDARAKRGGGHKLHVTTNPWSLLGENDEDSYLPIKFTNNLVMHCFYCYGISLTQPLTTWADTSLHFLLLKRSMANPISIICLSLLGLQPPSSLPLSTCTICRCPSP